MEINYFKADAESGKGTGGAGWGSTLGLTFPYDCFYDLRVLEMVLYLFYLE